MKSAYYCIMVACQRGFRLAALLPGDASFLSTQHEGSNIPEWTPACRYIFLFFLFLHGHTFSQQVTYNRNWLRTMSLSGSCKPMICIFSDAVHY